MYGDLSLTAKMDKQIKEWSDQMMKDGTHPLCKPSNPKDSVGIKKVPFSTIPAPVMAEVGLAMLEGALKYGRHNYRTVGVRASVYYDALLRHVTQWWEGDDIDPDSGLPHLVKAIACLVVLRDSQLMGNWQDDRPPCYSNGPTDKPWIEQLNNIAADLIDKYPEPKEAHTQLTSGKKPDLFELIKHGSEEHKAWLKEAISHYENGEYDKITSPRQ